MTFPVISALALAPGPAGSMWFTTGGKFVGLVTATGETKFVNAPQELRGTYGITRGPDGAMWVTNYLGASIARIDASGAVTSFSAACIRYPTAITTGTDGALWFADDSGSLGRITTGGRVRCYGDESRVGHPDAIAMGGDGALWAADRGGTIVRMTTQGAVTRYAASGMRLPGAIVSGGNGTLWFTDYLANAVGRIGWAAGTLKSTRPSQRPRVTFISDSVGAAIAFDIGAKAILERGVDLFLEPGQARTLGPVPSDGIAPPTVLELVAELGRRLGQTVVVEVGNNDVAGQYAANLEAALTALHAAGVKHVIWTTLHVTPDHTSYATINDAIVAAAARHPELTVLDWNAYAGSHPEWFQADGVHLTAAGPRALAQFVRAGLATTGLG